MPTDVEKAVKVLEKKSEIESPFGLATWMRKKGYKMPAKAEEKYELPTPKQEKELDAYQKKLREKVGLLQFGEKAEEESDEKREFRKSFEKQWDKPEPKPEPKKAEEEKSLAKDALKKFRTKVSDELNRRDENLKIIPKKAEEKLIEATPDTPKERMEQSRQKVTGPSFIDTKPSGKGKSLEEWASNVMNAFLAEVIPHGLGYKRIGDKKEIVDKTLHPMFKKYKKTDDPILPEKASEKTSSIKEMHKDHVTSPDSLYDRWKEGTKLPKIQTQPFASSDGDMLVYPDEFKKGMKEEQEHADVTGSDKEATKKIVLAHLAEDPKYYSKLGTVMKADEDEEEIQVGPAGPIDVSKGAPPGFIPRSHKKAEEDTERNRDYTIWQREKHEEKSKPLLKRVSEKLFGEEDQTSDYVESLKTRKMPTGWKKPVGPKPETEKDLPSERFSSEEGVVDKIKSTIKDLTSSPKPKEEKHIPLTKTFVRRQLQKAEEELDMPQKEFDEDALNELYCFMDWMHNKGFEAKDGDKLEEYMDRYDVEQFGKKAEEAQPPAQFKAPEERK